MADGDRSSAGGAQGPSAGVAGFLAGQHRLIVHARFRGGEAVIMGTPHGAETLNEYLRSGPVSRFFSRLYGLLVAVSTGCTALASGGGLIAGVFAGWLVLVAIVMLLVAGYVGIYHLAGWRCMRRHRASPLRKR